jgi:hypothetical protein
VAPGRRSPEAPGAEAPKGRPAGLPQLALGLAVGCLALLPLGAPYGVSAPEAVLVVACALLGAALPDLGAPDGPGPILKALARLLGLGRHLEHLTASSARGRSGAPGLHSPVAAAVFLALTSGLLLAGPAGGFAWAAASGAYWLHVALRMTLADGAGRGRPSAPRRRRFRGLLPAPPGRKARERGGGRA